MPSVDLAPFGIPQTIEGQFRATRYEGGRFLLLFNETHTDYRIIRQNLLNACLLIDGGFIGCVGVEGEYSFEGWSTEDIVAESQRLFAEHRTDDAMIDFFVDDAYDLDGQQPDLPHFFFGTCLKLLRPTVTIGCVEVQELADAAERVQQQLLVKAARELNVRWIKFTSGFENKTGLMP